MTNEEINLGPEVPATSALTKLTVNLTQTASGAIALAAELSKLSRTDVVNKALQLYAFCLLMEESGTEFYGKKGEGYELMKFSKM